MTRCISGELRRREFLKTCSAIAAAVAVGSVVSTSSATDEVFDSVVRNLVTENGLSPYLDHTSAVRPIIGTGGHGHTYPGATCPHGMVQLSPDTVGYKNRWDHTSGYHHPNDIIRGFSHTHLQGCGRGDLGDFPLMPVIGPVRWEVGSPGHGYCSRFSHDQEITHAGYYSVFLKTPGVRAELTATIRCGMHRYTYPIDAQPHIILDMVAGLDNRPLCAEFQVETPHTISGYRRTSGWAKERDAYFVMEFSEPLDHVAIQLDGQVLTSDRLETKAIGGKEIRSALHFAAPARAPIVVKVGISGTSIAGARKNLTKEIPYFDFDAVRHQAAAAWTRALTPIDAAIPEQTTREVFYTGMYHNLTCPTTFSDVDGTYRGADRKNHSPSGFTNYTTLSIWDIFRSQFPLSMIVRPQIADNMINTLLADYALLNRKSLPKWPLWGNETWDMIGFHAVAMILAAYTRGFRAWDVEALYEAVKVTAMGNSEYKDQFRKYGFIPSGAVSVSRSLDYAYDYWCAGALASLLGKQQDAACFYKLGQSYRNLFDPKTGFMRGKLRNGRWRTPFRPDQEYWTDYAEADAWQTSFNVMHDVPGLINLYGGDESFIAKLDAFFTAPIRVYGAPADISGMVGQDAQGNEPSNHIPYLYAFAGAAWKTQYWIRKVAALYKNTPNGIPGNDDCGQLSSWFVLTAMGFYPVNPATGVYVIGSPLVDRARIYNPMAKTTFTIIADNNSPGNCYIQSAKLNGEEMNRSWFTHADIVAGGELCFRMGGQPNKGWASAKADRPPSGLIS